ncbi:MAG: methyltransferase domain-containing protein [Defluviitaleaceae bacterium]|nr:methyltransferase domain-containing protein [Defluviitaleaceae bacterium]
MTLTRILPFTKQLLQTCVMPGDKVIDATCGNGHDTVFLSKLVGETGVVFAFDIQEQAIKQTRQQLEKEKRQNVTLILDSHANVHQYVKDDVRAAVFNLGYLPNSDHQVTTHGASTWEAVEKMLKLLTIGGVIILVIYHGHSEGKVERDYLENQIQTLDPVQTSVLKYAFLNKKDAPYVIAIEKVKVKNE